MSIKPFSIDTPDSALSDLFERLSRSRFVEASDQPWKAGTDPGFLRELVTYWRHGFDWRARERELNALPQFSANLDGRSIHFLHLRAVPTVTSVIPLVLTHGWPSCFLELVPLLSRLTDPAAHGADPADGFDVVIPSLPGFLYSDLPTDGVVTPSRIADLWVKLMTDILGYRRFGAYGGDIGSHVTGFLGATYFDQVLGIYTHHPNLSPDISKGSPVTPHEQAYLAKVAAAPNDGRGYSAIQSTRPDTLAAALIDSPVGLAAWITEKYRAWGDCAGDVESRFGKDALLTIVTLYWLTGCIGSSFRNYYDDKIAPALPLVKVPTGITLTSEDEGYPLEFAQRSYADIRQWRPAPRGGHFFALEEPDRLAVDLRDFFRPLRESQR
jgi:pimeloyl-ACP methyl ester carboxylesterase